MASSKQKSSSQLLSNQDPKGEDKAKADGNLSNVDRLKQLHSKVEVLIQNVEGVEDKMDLGLNALNNRFAKLEQKLGSVSQRLLVFGPAVTSLLEINKIILSNTTAPGE